VLRTSRHTTPLVHSRCRYRQAESPSPLGAHGSVVPLLGNHRLVEPLMPPGAREPGALYFPIYRLADSLHCQALYQNSRVFWFLFSHSDFSNASRLLAPHIKLTNIIMSCHFLHVWLITNVSKTT